ncbi:MAG: 4Fe-4S binding protein [Bacteroidota bacterium]
MRKLLKVLIDKRIIILAIIGISLYMVYVKYQISLWYILLAGSLTGLIFGKVFCRWICPLGLMMELMMSLSPEGKMRQMYQYHKIGCPIAWISGWLNKYSFFRIKLNADSCNNCGICDKECYIVAMEPAKFSLYKERLEMPGDSYTCSKCLKCVTACPNESLQYKH